MDTISRNDQLNCPVVLTGRGGSGTRLLSEIARHAGMFLGNELNRQGDSVEWVSLIYELAREVGAGRNLPTGAQHRPRLRRHAENILGTRESGNGLWGMKLPETMLVLPLLTDAFPGCKIVHLVRHPISCSLRRSHMTSRLDNPVGDVVLPAAYEYSGRDPERIPQDEVWQHNAYSWYFQVNRIVAFGRAELPPSRYLEVSYEEICATPASGRGRVLRFLDLNERTDTDVPRIDCQRMNPWRSDDYRAHEVWSICGSVGALLGYSEKQATVQPKKLHP